MCAHKGPAVSNLNLKGNACVGTHETGLDRSRLRRVPVLSAVGAAAALVLASVMPVTAWADEPEPDDTIVVDIEPTDDIDKDLDLEESTDLSAADVESVDEDLNEEVVEELPEAFEAPAVEEEADATLDEDTADAPAVDVSAQVDVCIGGRSLQTRHSVSIA